MAKVVTLDDFLRMKREAKVKAEVEAKANKEKKEKVKKTISFLTGIVLYWIASFILTMGFFAVVLSTL